MKLFLLSFSLFCVLNNVYGQREIDSLDYSSLLDSLPNEEKEVLRKQANALYFSHTLYKQGDPSITSTGFSDFNYNLNQSKQKKSFLLNGTIQPIINVGGKRWFIKNYIHTFHMLPSLTFRIFQNDSNQKDHSNPVRTPSLGVRLNYWFTHAKLWNDSLKYKKYFGLSVFHHSNGQDNYEFEKDSSVNTYNGNFSEILALEFFTGGMRAFDKPIAPSMRNVKSKGFRHIQFESKSSLLYWKLSYELHPRGFTNEKFYKYNLYGRNRLNIQLGYLINPKIRHLTYSKQRNKWIPMEKTYMSREVRRIVLNCSYILDGVYNTGTTTALKPIGFFDISKRFNTDITWYERIGTTNDFAIFMRVGYYGSDPYNIYFQESLFIARVGIAFGVFMAGEKK